LGKAKHVQKNSQKIKHTAVLYMQHQKKSALNSSTNIEPKELNLGVNSVKHFSAKSDSRFYLFVSPSVDQILS
jgi:hypothetical protein